MVLLLLLAGCSSNSDHTETYQISGTVTLDGKPLPDATIVFLPDNGRSSAGKTSASGEYTLFYSEGVKGAIPGRHRVQISASEVVPGKLNSEGGEIRKEILPAEYHSKSTLVYEVNANRDDVNFDLKSK
jgi:hypothetical protein